MRMLYNFRLVLIQCTFLVPILAFCDATFQSEMESAYLNFKVKPLGFTTAITSDKAGFVWISTIYGIYRYDGTNYVPLEQLMVNPPEISMDVRLLEVDSFNQLWIYRTELGLYRIDLNTFQWHHYSSFIRDHKTSFYYSIYEDAERGLFIPHQEGLALYNREQDSFEIIEIDSIERGVRLITGYDKDKLIVTSRTRVFIYDLAKREAREIKSLRGTSRYISNIELDPDEHLWVTNWNEYDRSLLRYDIDADSVMEIFSLADPELDHAAGSDIWQMVTTEEHMYFITNSSGLWRYGYDEGKMTKLVLKTDYEVKNINQIRFMHIDPFDRIWLGTSVEVLQQISYEKEIKVIQNNSVQDVLPSNNLYTVATLSTGEVAIGTDQGLVLYDSRRNSFRRKTFPIYNENPYNNQVRNLLQDGTHLWVITWSGMMRLRLSDLAIVERYVTYHNAGHDHPEDILKLEIGAPYESLRTGDGVIWLINVNKEIVRLTGSPGDREVKKYQIMLDTVQQLCHTLEYDPHWGLMVATQNGLWKYDEKQDHFTHCIDFISTEPLEKAQLDLAINDRADFFVLTHDTLYQLFVDEYHYEFKKVGHPEGFSNLNHLVIDHQNVAWLTEKRGILRWELQNHKLLHLNNEVHLNGSSFDRMPGVVNNALSDDGHLFFATSNGLLDICLDEFNLNPSPPDLVITSLLVNGDNLPKYPAHSLQKIVLPYDQNNIRISYSILNDNDPVARKYSYRINGQNWNHVGNQSNISLTALAPGKYHFELTAWSADGVSTIDGRQLLIYIRAPWYRSALAYLSYVLIIILISYLFYRSRLTSSLAKKEASRIKELDRFKNQFFTNITHELRTPLTVISGMSDKIEKSPSTWSKRGARLIKTNSETLLNLINQILDLSKLEQGLTQQKLVHGDIISYLKYLTSSFGSHAEIHGQHLEFNSALDRFVMDFDKESIRGIMTNLISNAIKYSHEYGAIEVRAQVDNRAQTLKIEVRDQGIGIDPEHMPMIFDRYYQANHNENSNIGTGIGLALTRELVELAGGTISASSQPGEGSTFKVLLPIKHSAVVASDLPSAQASTSNPTGKIAGDTDPYESNILIVEDHKDVTEYIRSCLDENYQCHWASDGKSGLEMAVDLIPDLIITDIMMPMMNGFELVKHVRQDQRTDHIPVIMLTARITTQDRIQGIDQGADVYLGKPFEEEELLAHIKNLISQRAKLKEKFQDLSIPPALAPIIGRNNSFIEMLRRVINDHLDDPNFSVEELAKEVHMSSRQLARKLKAISDLTPHKLIRSVRIQAAKVLLESEELNISEISILVGFSNPQYFATVFKKETGKSPGEYAG